VTSVWGAMRRWLDKKVLCKQRERQHLGAELERDRLARSGDQRNVQRLQRDLRERQQLLEELQQVLKAPKKDYG
jgi:hypothetical protein